MRRTMMAALAGVALGAGVAAADNGGMWGKSGNKAADGPAIAIEAGQDCPKTLSSLGQLPGVVLGCWCPPGRAAGTVWGSGPYTADSDLCAAARHAGAVGTAGGGVWARMTEGREAFTGTARNGIATRDYGRYDATFTILRGIAAAADGAADAALAACPAKMPAGQDELRCHCAPDRFTGNVWGTDVYTNDSGICAAALHAGVVTPAGGAVSVLRMPGRDRYQGSSRNGITTADYGSWGGSIQFLRE